MSTELSVEDTEYILEHFQDLKDGNFSGIASALCDLAALPETLAPDNPPLLPSQAIGTVLEFGRSTKRTASIAIAATGVAITTAFAAAALSGVGPQPVVHFVKAAVQSIEDATKKVFNITTAPLVPVPTNNNEGLTPTEVATPSSAPVPAPAPVPVPVPAPTILSVEPVNPEKPTVASSEDENASTGNDEDLNSASPKSDSESSAQESESTKLPDQKSQESGSTSSAQDSESPKSSDIANNLESNETAEGTSAQIR